MPNKTNHSSDFGTVGRTIALVGHRSSGKTSVAESMLFIGGVVRSAGSVLHRTTLLDSDPESRRRGSTLQAGFAWMTWRDHTIQLVDTPGAAGMESVRDAVLCGVDAALVVIDGSAGVELGTARALARCRDLDLPVLVVVNKCERSRPVDDLLTSIAAYTDTTVLPLTLPDTSSASQEPSNAVVDIVDQCVWRYLDDGSGQHSIEPLPRPERFETYRERLSECIALSDDALLDYYLEYLELPTGAFAEGLRRVVRERSVTPVVFTSAVDHVGVHHLLDTLVDTLPSAADSVAGVQCEAGVLVEARADSPFSAQVLATSLDASGAPFAVCRVRSGTPSRKGGWRAGRSEAPRRVNKLYHLRGNRRGLQRDVQPGTIVATWDLPGVRPGDVLSADGTLSSARFTAPCADAAVLLTPDTAADERRLPSALSTLLSADGWLSVDEEPLTGGTVLCGPSSMLLALAVARLAELGVQVTSSRVPIGYRETPVATVRAVEAQHLRTDSDEGVVEFGRVCIDLLPTDSSTPLRFIADCCTDDVPEAWHGAIVQGAMRALGAGPLAGYPATGVQIVLVGGDYNALFTTDEHMALAAERAVRTALDLAGTALVEPWVQVALSVDDAFVGPCVASTGAHRGRVLNIGNEGGATQITLTLPEREWRKMADHVSSVTAGTADYTSRHSHLDLVPAGQVGSIVQRSPVAHRRAQSASSNTPTPSEQRLHARGR